jgi:predicted nucleic acid-binding protein
LILIDAGPLIALFRGDDQHHAACASAVHTLRAPLATVWPAVTEAMHLLRSWEGKEGLWQRLLGGDPRILPLGDEDFPRMRELMGKYRDLPMDLADAALVRAAERERIDTIFTIDRKDFALYRPRHVRRFKILP